MPRHQTSALIIESVLLGDNIDKGAKRRRRLERMKWCRAREPRAFSVPIESERGSISLFGRIFATQTGAHFAGKCSMYRGASR
jgi:hypothetical protein